MVFRSFFVLFLTFCSTLQGQGLFEVAVFSKTTGFRHGSINNGKQALEQLALENNFNCKFTEDAEEFVDFLASSEVAVFLNTTGDILNNAQQLVFEQFIENGGGFVGIHSASDTEYDWPWYGNLVGRYFAGHPAIQSGQLSVENNEHPSTKNLPPSKNRVDEWYNFETPFPPNLNVLITIDESTYSGGNMGDFHPLSWFHTVGLGRSFYTAMGHTNESYQDEYMLNHLLGGLFWAANQTGTSVSENDFPIQHLLYFKNNQQKLVIKELVKSSSPSFVSVYTPSGKLILKKTLYGAQQSFDVAHLKASVYFVHISNKVAQWQYAVVKSK